MHESDKTVKKGGDFERGRTHIANSRDEERSNLFISVYLATFSLPLITMSLNSKINICN